MGKGRATWRDREFQIMALGMVQRTDEFAGTIPYTDDGIDIPFKVCDTTVTFDAALKAPNGSLIVVECKRWWKPVPQDAVFAFQKKIECLRQDTQNNVVGVLPVRRAYNIGALKLARRFNLVPMHAEHNQQANCSVVYYVEWNTELGKLSRRGQTNISADIQGRGTLTAANLRTNTEIP